MIRLLLLLGTTNLDGLKEKKNDRLKLRHWGGYCGRKKKVFCQTGKRREWMERGKKRRDRGGEGAAASPKKGLLPVALLAYAEIP